MHSDFARAAAGAAQLHDAHAQPSRSQQAEATSQQHSTADTVQPQQSSEASQLQIAPMARNDSEASEGLVYQWDEAWVEKRYEVMHLRVIHRRRRTGFEETKDFPIRINELIAGRYQVCVPCSPFHKRAGIAANDLLYSMKWQVTRVLKEAGNRTVVAVCQHSRALPCQVQSFGDNRRQPACCCLSVLQVAGDQHQLALSAQYHLYTRHVCLRLGTALCLHADVLHSLHTVMHPALIIQRMLKGPHLIDRSWTSWGLQPSARRYRRLTSRLACWCASRLSRCGVFILAVISLAFHCLYDALLPAAPTRKPDSVWSLFT